MHSTRKRPRRLIACVVLFSGTLANAQTILRVDADIPPGGDGVSWSTAYHDLQDALRAAVALTGQGQTVEMWVAAGTYRPDGGTAIRSRHFELRNNISLYGGFTGIETFRARRDSDPLTNGTILTGDLLDDDAPPFEARTDNSYNVVYALDADETAILDGFTVRAGNADSASGGFGAAGRNGGAAYLKNTRATLTNCAFEDSKAVDWGGGVFVLADFGNAALTFTNCRFWGNLAPNGGGLGCSPSPGWTAAPVLTDCSLEWNTATLNGGGSRGPGAFNHVVVANNRARDGGGMDLHTGDLTLFDCDIQFNTATGVGGGLNVQRSQYGASAYLAAVRVEDNDAATDGGGVFTTIAITLAECQFRRNEAGDEGGAICFDAYLDQNGEHAIVTPIADTLIFDGNTAVRGGAMAVVHSARPRLNDCRFYNSLATERGGALATDWQLSVFAPQVYAFACEFRWNTAPVGGAVYNYAEASYVRCDFLENDSTSSGGAVYAVHVFAPFFVLCRFHGNVAGDNGGAVYNLNSNVQLHNCELTGNRAAGDGGAVAGATADSIIQNCTITGNVSGGSFGGGVHHPGLGLSVENSIVWGNSPERIFASGGTFYGFAQNSCIAGGAPGSAIFDANPYFVRPPHDGGDGWGDQPGTPEDESLNDDFGDLRLQANSPCIDAADNARVPNDAVDVDGDANTAEPLPWDLLIDERFREDAGAPNVGVGTAPIADIGAYEFLYTSRLRGDTNCDGRTDFFDIDPFIQALFDYPGYQAAFPACFGNADVNLDSLVNFFDIDPFVEILFP